MKRKEKIWLAALLFAVTEMLAVPEILFPDCIQQKTETEAESSWTRETQKFEWKFWFLQKICEK